MFSTFRRLTETFYSFYNIELDSNIRERQLMHPNKLVRYGRQGFSQSDEDGITFEIIRRLNITTGVFAEYGVGDGTENNTLSLLGLGWKGFWVGGEELAFDIPQSSRLFYYKQWVTLANVVTVFDQGRNACGVQNVNVVSVDLDGGNDLFFCKALLEHGVRPELFIVEYNGRFPPPMRFCIRYDDKHVWKYDDYQGASLMSFVDLFSAHGYRLICCNAATGVNAFFVREAAVTLFPETPEKVTDIYSAPHPYLHSKYNRVRSLKTIGTMLDNRP